MSQVVLATAISGAFTFGVMIQMLSSIKPQLARRLGVHEDRIDNLWAMMSLLLPPLMALGGLLVDVWDLRWVLLLGSVSVGFSLFGLAATSAVGVARLCFLGAALGGAWVSVATVVLMPQAFFGQAEVGASQNMGHVFFALGALVAPALVDVLLRTCGFGRTLTVLGIMMLVPAALVGLVPARALDAPSKFSDALMLLADPMIWIAASVFFLYAPIEGCLHTWGMTYLRNMGHTEKSAPRLIAGFWSMFLAGRLVMAWLQHMRLWDPSQGDPWAIVLLAVLATVMLGNLAGTVSRGAATTGLLMLGFWLGPIFPTLIGVLFVRHGDLPGTAFGIVFAAGSLGSLLLAPLIGARMNRTSAQTALRIPLVLGLLLSL